MKTYAQVKAEYKRVRKGNEALQRKVERYKEKVDTDEEIQRMQKKLNALYKRASKLSNEISDREDLLFKPAKKAHSRLSDWNDEFGRQSLERAKEAYEEADDLRLSKDLEKRGVRNTSEARVYLKGLYRHIQPLWVSGDKDGRFYKKAELDNGVIIYHSKADSWNSWSTYNTNHYYAFLKGKLIGHWKKDQPKHAGDTWIESSSNIYKEEQRELTYYEWRDLLKEVKA